MKHTLIQIQLLFVVVLALLCPNTPALAYEIAVVKTSNNKVNAQIEAVFFQELSRLLPDHGLKEIQPHRLEEVFLSGKESTSLHSQLRYKHPELLLALGSRALKAALSLENIPIVYLLVAHPQAILEDAASREETIAGISLDIPADIQIKELQAALPQIQRIGLVYDPKRTGSFVRDLQKAGTNLTFLAQKATSPKEVPDLLESLDTRVDLLWMLPDATTVNRKTLQSYMLFSIRNKVPLLSFSDKLLHKGATIAITFAVDGVAKQAAELAAEILLDSIDAETPVLLSPKASTFINHAMAKKLGLKISSKRDKKESGEPEP